MVRSFLKVAFTSCTLLCVLGARPELAENEVEGSTEKEVHAHQHSDSAPPGALAEVSESEVTNETLQLDAEAELQQNRMISNGTDDIVFVCHSFCVICNDNKRAVYIRRSKSNEFYAVAAVATVGAGLTVGLSVPAVLAGAAAVKVANHVVGDLKTSLDELSNVCSAVSLLAFKPDSGEPEWEDQVKVDDIPKKDGNDHNLVYLKKDLDHVKKNFGGGHPIGSDNVFKDVFGKSGLLCGEHGGVKETKEEGMGSGLFNSVTSLGGNLKGAGYFATCKAAAKKAAGK